MEIPAELIVFSDQHYAAAQEMVTRIVDSLVEDMRERPHINDAVPWAMSVSQILIWDREDRLSTNMYEMWQAAMYRLARQRIKEDGG